MTDDFPLEASSHKGEIYTFWGVITHHSSLITHHSSLTHALTHSRTLSLSRLCLFLQRVRVDFNPISTTYCPVHNTLEFHAVSGLGDVVAYEMGKPESERLPVYMFPEYNEATHRFDFYEKAGTAKIWDWVNRALVGAGLEGCTPHSLRASACVWGIRCFAEAEYVRAAGRWSQLGASFGKYFRKGSQLREHFLSINEEDPIFRFWKWTYNVVADVDG